MNLRFSGFIVTQQNRPVNYRTTIEQYDVVCIIIMLFFSFNI